MSQMEKLVVILRNYTENDSENDPASEQDIGSMSAGLQENTDILRQDCRSLLDSNYFDWNFI